MLGGIASARVASAPVPRRARTLKGYIESTTSDLIPPNTIVCKIVDGENYRGEDDFVEFEAKIKRRAFVFHCEAAG
jgi:hypothetical protein